MGQINLRYSLFIGILQDLCGRVELGTPSIEPKLVPHDKEKVYILLWSD